MILTLIIIMVKVDIIIIIMVKVDIIHIIMVKVDILIIIMVKVDNPNRAISNVDDYSDSSRLLAATILRFLF